MSRGVLIGYKTASDAASRLCSFGVVLLAVRFLSTEQFGLFSLAWAAGWMIALGGDFGLQIHLTRQVALNPTQASRLFDRFLRLRLALGGAVFAVLVAGALALSRPEQITSFLLVALSQTLGSLVDFHNHLYRGLQRSEIESTLNLVTRFATLALAAVLLYAFESLLALAVALVLGNGLALTAAHVLSARLIYGSRPASDVDGRPPEPEVAYGGVLKRVLPIGLGIFFSAFYFRIDLFFIEQWNGPEPVALYNAVFRLIDAVRLLPAAVMAVLFPELCRPGWLKLLAYSALSLLGVSLVLAMAGYWQAPMIVRLCYGEAYLPAVPVFRLLLFSLPLLYVNLVLTHQLIALNQERAYAAMCGLGVVLSLLLNYFLVPALGTDGAALSCLIRESILTSGCILMLLLPTIRRLLPTAVKSETGGG